ncbi:MAG: hypothetical protein OEX22_13430 [Cyclobacteriaceae bacterium]|nr:hypothetical protein [Cyclobacteriaceae bacterium]
MKTVVTKPEFTQERASNENIAYQKSFEKIASAVHNTSSKKNDPKFQFNDSFFS